MRGGLYVAAMLGVMAASCSTQKAVTSRESAVELGELSVNTSRTRGYSAEVWQMLRARCDTLRLQFRADSIRTPGGTVYGATADAVLDSPLAEAAGGRTIAEEDSTGEHRHNVTAAGRDEISNEERESTAVAQPAPAAAWILGGVAGLLAAICTACGIGVARRRSKR